MAMLLDLIQSHPTWDVVDASKLSDYMRCPRFYFYRYILGWENSLPNNHLTFGTCWHLAVEHLARQGYTPASLEEAKLLFMARYRQDFPPETDEGMNNKRPDIALNALQDYFSRFKSDLARYNVLHTEIGGVVMISPTAEIHFKMDWVGQQKDSGKYLYIDHKTASRKGNDLSFKLQMLTYRHVLHCIFPHGEIAPSRVRTTVFYKSKPGEYMKNPALFEETEVSKSKEQMQAWLINTNIWFQNLKYDMQLLEEASTDDIAMLAFPMNDNACHDFGRECLYYSLCTNWANPAANTHRRPYGMKETWWDPREQELIRERIEEPLVPEEVK